MQPQCGSEEGEEWYITTPMKVSCDALCGVFLPPTLTPLDRAGREGFLNVKTAGHAYYDTISSEPSRGLEGEAESVTSGCVNSGSIIEE